MATASSWQPSYDVFVSFKSTDTRNNFVDQLKKALRDAKIHVFEDSKVKKGTAIGPALFKAIEEAKVSIVVLSETYAESEWCLDELEKISECEKEKEQLVLPVFFNVTPSEVRNLRGSFAKAFEGNDAKIERWSAILSQTANREGFENQQRPETRVIEEIVDEVEAHLRRKTLPVEKHLVGLSQVEVVCELIGKNPSEVRIIVIYGIEGIGKTVLAQATYNHCLKNFMSFCFLKDVRKKVRQGHNKESGLISLQKELLDAISRANHKVESHHEGQSLIIDECKKKKMLLVIDDVDHLEQVDALAQHTQWFGGGSRIIITTRDESLLKNREHGKHKVENLSLYDSLALFQRCAFRPETDQSERKSYDELSSKFLTYTGGHPSAIKGLGYYLCGRSLKNWKQVLREVADIPANQILEKLSNYTAYDDKKYETNTEQQVRNVNPQVGEPSGEISTISINEGVHVPRRTKEPFGQDLQGKATGNTLTLAARELAIDNIKHPKKWRWIYSSWSGSSEAAELLCGWWLEIRGNMKARKLSPGTKYAAYLVFKLANNNYGLNTARVAIRSLEKTDDDVLYDEAVTVHLDSKAYGSNERHPQKRTDGWLEIKLGEFMNYEGNDDTMEVRLMEKTDTGEKRGLIVAGIQFRPE